jgi:hypothetical protein
MKLPNLWMSQCEAFNEQKKAVASKYILVVEVIHIADCVEPLCRNWRVFRGHPVADGLNEASEASGAFSILVWLSIIVPSKKLKISWLRCDFWKFEITWGPS